MNEFDLIAGITSRLEQQPNVLLGPGDDAAVLACSDGRVATSTDVLVEDVHFRQSWTTPYELGRRAAAQNFADIAAMGGVPTALVVGVAAPKAQDPQWFFELSRGLQDECDAVGASVIGGDLSAGAQIMIAVTVLGDLQGRAPVTRARAGVGDTVGICGRLGWSAAGLAALSSSTPVEPSLVEAYRAPSPPYASGPIAALAGATAMIDISDGLLGDAAHIANASGVSLALNSAALAPDPELRAAADILGCSAQDWVLTGGEDHALLATFPQADALPHGFRAIGHVVARQTAAVLVDDQRHSGVQGHDHFG